MNSASKKNHRSICFAGLLICGLLLFSSFFSLHNTVRNSFRFPYKKAGLTERQAAAHLLSRFTYGATPGQIDAVIKEGLENWFQKQLDARLPDDSLNRLLSGYDALKLSNAEVAAIYPKGGQALRMAVKEGVISKDSVKPDNKTYRELLQNYMQEKGLKSQQELFRQLISQKILKAAYGNNQLQEVMTSFWFNHFNVSITKSDCAEFIPAYERDVIRPNSLGKFSDLLLATAKSPAMLYFLDNFSSSGSNNKAQATQSSVKNKQATTLQTQMAASADRLPMMVDNKVQNAKKTQGLNENYAREVMELHTLGVDGGYTQQDVTQAARVLTGWSVYPTGSYGQAGKNALDKMDADQLKKRGYVHEGDFLFNPNRHDNGEKMVLGKHFGPDGGYEEGVQLLNMLAHHPSAAKFVCGKLAVRFVSDKPPQSLINKMAETFKNKDGDIKQVLITMVSAPEFWSTSSVREKTKSPFELTIAAVRSLNADIQEPYQLYNWINKMGEKMYYYQAPTGFPDKGQYWINTGALLNRMNFGLALASGRIPGVRVDLMALNNHHEPESSQAALVTYSKIIMPERNLEQTIKRLTPMLNDPNLVKKVEDASAKAAPPQKDMMQEGTAMTAGNNVLGITYERKGKGNYMAKQKTGGNNSLLAQVVGVIIGSPEYQRR